MGQSTDAILFYGYCWDEETDKPWAMGEDYDEDEDEADEDDDWEDRLAAALGIEAPDVEYSEKTKPKFEKYWDKKRKAAAAEACEVATHCSCEYPMPYVAIKESVHRANRGSMEPVESLKVGRSWDKQLREFCELMDIPEAEPKWWLVSLWC